MKQKYSQLITGIIMGLVGGLLIAKLAFVNNGNIVPTPSVKNQQQENHRNNNNNNNNNDNIRPSQKGNIPAKVFNVLQYIKANNHAMDGYVGGRIFTNRERVLPMDDAQGNRIDYQEWDVNPKREGQNRGTERICTGSDGRSWYTNDHYRTFTEIK
jgi:guanyl-specific ribonuclease Sa